MLKWNLRPAWGKGRRNVDRAIQGAYYFFIAALLSVSAHAKLISAPSVEIDAAQVQEALGDKGLFLVDAPGTSWARNLFEYSPATGVLLQRLPNDAVKPIGAFGAVPAFNEQNLEIIPFGGSSRTVIVRHGFWMSIIDMAADKLVMGNIGPLETRPRGRDTYLREIAVNGVSRYYTFAALAALRGRTPDRDGAVIPRLFLVDALKQTVGCVQLRDDIDPLHFQVTPDASGSALHVTGDFEAGKFTEKQRAMLLQYWSHMPGSTKRNAIQPDELLHASMVVDLKEAAPTVTQLPGMSFFSPIPVTEQRARTQMVGMLSNDAMAQKLHLPEAAPEALLAQSNPLDSAGRASAAALISRKVQAAKAVDAQVRAGMQGIHGQKEAIDAFVALALGRATSKKAQVAVNGGPTGTGKTSSVSLFVKTLYPENSNSFLKISFANQTSNTFLQTTLFGSGPGYIGSDSPSLMMRWLLDNPDGGVVLFDEIEKAPVESLRLLMSFLDDQEIVMNPPLVEAMATDYIQRKVPLDKWPRAIREATQDGTVLDIAVTLKLTPNHFIFLNTNAGSALFNGSGISNVAGQRLETEQQLRSANARFTGEVIKSELRERGYEDELLNRVSRYIPFKVILPEDHARIVSDRLADVQAYFKKEYMIDVAFAPDAYAYLEKETHSPLDGARFVDNQVRAWVTESLSHALLQSEKLKPGDAVTIALDPSDGTRKDRLVLAAKENGKWYDLGRYDVGKAPPAAPIWLLERAEKNLLPLLEQKVRGHQYEKQQIANRILSKLKEAVKQPTKAGGVVTLEYNDGPPGTGKTETAKVIAEAVFENPKSMVTIEMNNINSMDDFYRMFVQPLIAAARSNPEGLVVLLDEFPRAGGDNPYVRKEIQNMLLSILDEGMLPAIPWESKTVGDKQVRANEKTPLPKATIFYGTGNMIEAVLGNHAEFMNNVELGAQLQWLQKHPEQFRAVYAQNFVAALRSRMGEPNIFTNLTDDDLAWLRDERFFPEAVALLKADGIDVTMADSAKEYFKKEQIAIRGGRWVRDKMDVAVRAPLNAWLLGVPKYKGSKVVVEFDPAVREMNAKLYDAGGALSEEKTLAKMPRSRSEIHPDVKARDKWMTHVHEAGHAVVMRALFGEDAVDRILTFGGAEGGRTEFATDAPGHEPYLTTQKGPFRLAVMLGGHMAERLFMNGNMSNGASSDFEHIREAAKTMILDGSLFGSSPEPLLKDPQTGALLLSDRRIADLEHKQLALMRFAQRLAQWVLENNPQLIQKVAEAMEKNPSQPWLDRVEFEAIVKEVGIKTPDNKQLRKIMLADRKTHRTCREMLLGEESSFMDRVLDVILRRG